MPVATDGIDAILDHIGIHSCDVAPRGSVPEYPVMDREQPAICDVGIGTRRPERNHARIIVVSRPGSNRWWSGRLLARASALAEAAAGSLNRERSAFPPVAPHLTPGEPSLLGWDRSRIGQT